MKLREFIRIDITESGVDVPCEVTPGHMTRKYVTISFEKMVMRGAMPTLDRIELRVCPLCFSQYAYDVAQIGRDVSVR